MKVPVVGVRAALAGRWRRLADGHAGLPEAGWWRRQVARVESGEPVEVSGWQIGRGALCHDRFRVDGDGTVTRVDR